MGISKANLNDVYIMLMFCIFWGWLKPSISQGGCILMLLLWFGAEGVVR